MEKNLNPGFKKSWICKAGFPYLEKLVIWRQGEPCGTGTLGPRRIGPRQQTESSQTGRPGLRTTDSPEPTCKLPLNKNIVELNVQVTRQVKKKIRVHISLFGTDTCHPCAALVPFKINHYFKKETMCSHNL
jgi:hypothetical protein